ncbi:type IV pilin protein [Colwelliaceae bacterium 6471]
MKNSLKQIGFTLIELMIAVAIVGILAAVAYPSYVDFVKRSNRAEAQSELLRIANLQEQYYMDHRTYTSDMTQLGLGADPYIPEQGNYSIDTSAIAADGSTYTLTATAINAQASDTTCAKFNVNELGTKSATSANCWE